MFSTNNGHFIFDIKISGGLQTFGDFHTENDFLGKIGKKCNFWTKKRFKWH